MTDQVRVLKERVAKLRDALAGIADQNSGVWGWRAHEALRRDELLRVRQHVRQAQATSAGEPCQACGKPPGTGTLLDFQPDLPPAGRELGVPVEDWRTFAARYLCPVCATARRQEAGQ